MDVSADAEDTLTSSLTAYATATDDDNESETERRVTEVANGWMFDFVFLSVCRCFKERNLHDFNAALSTLDGEEEEGWFVTRRKLRLYI